MDHLDEGTLQAFLDDELRHARRVEAAEHLLACDECGRARDELAGAHAAFSEAMAVLDVVEPVGTAPPGPAASREAGWTGPVVKAAGLVLLLAAAASAAVPGSPVREWIVNVVDPRPVGDPAPVIEPAPVTPAPAPVAISLPVADEVEVVLTGFEGTAVRLVETDSSAVTLSAVAAETDPVFSTAPGRIEARGAVGGRVTVALPRSLRAARLVVDGQVYAEKEAGELTIRVPGETVDGATTWR